MHNYNFMLQKTLKDDITLHIYLCVQASSPGDSVMIKYENQWSNSLSRTLPSEMIIELSVTNLQESKNHLWWSIIERKTKLSNNEVILGKLFLTKRKLRTWERRYRLQAPNTVIMKFNCNSCWSNFKIKCHVQGTECISGK